MTELSPYTAGLPLSPEQARDAMREYQDISNALIDPAEDLQTIRTRAGVKTFPKRSALQKLANAYRVSTEILERELTHDDGGLVRCDAVVRATHPDGRFADGDGACSRDEDRFAHGAEKLDHDLPATAVTRATNRAISNLIAFGAVSAEEADASGERLDTPTGLPAWAQPIGEPVDIVAPLVAILRQLGVEGVEADAVAIARSVFDGCDNSVPVCVSDLIGRLAELSVPTDPPSVDADATEGSTSPTTAPEAETSLG